jgi:threonine/homoserine/homoserine lactone efflux protein
LTLLDLRLRGIAAITVPMDPTAALLAGLVAGLAIAMQVGAVSLLLVEAAVVAGPRAGVAAGMGVATADLAFAAVAAAAGGAAGAALSSHEGEIRFAAAATIAAIAAHGLVAIARGGAGTEVERRAAGNDGPRGGAGTDRRGATRFGWRRGAALGHYSRFLAITAANPLTIASFAAVAAALSLDGPTAAVAFAGGVGLASAAWHLVLTVAAGHAGRRMTPRVRRGLAIGGRLAVLAIAAQLALGG